MKDRRLSEPSPPVVLADAGARKEDEHLRLVGQRSSSPRSLTRSIDPGLLFPSGSGSIRHHWVSMLSPLTAQPFCETRYHVRCPKHRSLAGGALLLRPAPRQPRPLASPTLPGPICHYL